MPHLHGKKNPLHGENFSFFFCLPDYPEEKAEPIKKTRKRSIEIIQSAKGRSRDILAHSFALKTLDL